MIYRRREGGTIRIGINYDFNEISLFQLIIKIPLPAFRKFVNYLGEKPTWHFYCVQLYFRIRNFRNPYFDWLSMRHWFVVKTRFYWSEVKNTGSGKLVNYCGYPLLDWYYKQVESKKEEILCKRARHEKQ